MDHQKRGPLELPIEVLESLLTGQQMFGNGTSKQADQLVCLLGNEERIVKMHMEHGGKKALSFDEVKDVTRIAHEFHAANRAFLLDGVNKLLRNCETDTPTQLEDYPVLSQEYEYSFRKLLEALTYLEKDVRRKKHFQSFAKSLRQFLEGLNDPERDPILQIKDTFRPARRMQSLYVPFHDPKDPNYPEPVTVSTLPPFSLAEQEGASLWPLYSMTAENVTSSGAPECIWEHERLRAEKLLSVESTPPRKRVVEKQWLSIARKSVRRVAPRQPTPPRKRLTKVLINDDKPVNRGPRSLRVKKVPVRKGRMQPLKYLSPTPDRAPETSVEPEINETPPKFYRNSKSASLSVEL